MNTCIKCGREIPDGELFCRECALNPGAISEDGHAMPAPRGKMQKPVVQPPKPKPIPQPSAPAAPKKRQSGHGVIIAILCVFTALSLGLSIYLIANSASQRVSLRLRESDLEEREESLATLEQSLLDAQQELQSAKDELSQQAQTIEELQKNFTSAQSTVSQTQYDMMSPSPNSWTRTSCLWRTTAQAITTNTAATTSPRPASGPTAASSPRPTATPPARTASADSQRAFSAASGWVRARQRHEKRYI